MNGICLIIIISWLHAWKNYEKACKEKMYIYLYINITHKIYAHIIFFVKDTYSIASIKDQCGAKPVDLIKKKVRQFAKN